MTARHFFKLEATENDFVFLEEEVLQDDKRRLLITRACNRHNGIGADGLVFVHKTAQGWQWRFFNSDASETDVCGNAARCMAKFLTLKGEDPKNISWTGTLGQFRAIQVNPEQFKVTWPLKNTSFTPISEDLSDLLSGLNDFGLAGTYLINSGVPHLVLLNHEYWTPELRLANGPRLRSHSSLGKEGANVTWISLKDLSACTFERGVEAETQACGSGALAAFLALERYHLEKDPQNPTDAPPSHIDFKFPGGVLGVSRDSTHANTLWLSGKTRLVFEGTWEF